MYPLLESAILIWDMFLLARLHMKLLLEQVAFTNLTTALEKLPDKLHDAYDRIRLNMYISHHNYLSHYFSHYFW
jgi:hypothetical protein